MVSRDVWLGMAIEIGTQKGEKGPHEACVGEAARTKIIVAVFGPRRPIAQEIIFKAAADIEAVAIGREVAGDRTARDRSKQVARQRRTTLVIDRIVDIAIGKAANRVDEEVVGGERKWSKA